MIRVPPRGTPHSGAIRLRYCALRANRNTDLTEKFCVRFDVAEEFPFLVAKDVAVL